MRDEELREILAQETRRHWTVEEARNIERQNDTPSSRAALAAMRRVDDAAFIRWLGKLSDELMSTYGYTAAQAKEYASDQPEAWREFFNDDYTPADAAAEDQRAGAE